MAGWFGKAAPARVHTDTVAPMRYFDDSIAQGEIEYHLPAEFTPERPAVAFSQVQTGMAIAAHPVASQLPRAHGNRPIIAGDPELFTSLVRPEGMPTSINDWLTQDRGLLGLHVVSFTDATIVVFYFNHTTFDLMGWGALMTAWTHVLHGREHLVAKPFGGDPGSTGFDQLKDLGTNPTEPHVLAHKHMKIGSLIGYGVRNVFDLAFKAKENRIVCIPGAFIDKLRARSMAELSAAAEPGATPFLSDADVLAAWWARLAASTSQSPDSERTISIQYAASARKALGMSVDYSRDPYLSNLFTMLYTIMPARDLINKPVSHTAKEIRRSIVEQGTREQVESYYAIQRQTPGKMLPFMGDAGMHAVLMSNWGKANLYAHDFSPAALFSEDRGKAQYPSYIQATQVPFNYPEGFLVIGQDMQKNYWLYGFRMAGLWAKVEKELAELDV
ncbi:hypothetical protein PFICI_12015 [Pestalotiopsis fici W106-1]|uniref:Uncharacterized protein n=1 Tax=Pestalotiopsis fici (strain W106-1 / CGMCC3.15140) TaxID=1229662 RepID=W3WS04_PESFW|nr:uncharacterized protein PFICI_12015 [Pestalotiopsis fici W106-1]ETS76628.1 hypothetical protein PFICI_12015 [Pestalotiopsis fici W106-1]